MYCVISLEDEALAGVGQSPAHRVLVHAEGGEARVEGELVRQYVDGGLAPTLGRTCNPNSSESQTRHIVSQKGIRRCLVAHCPGRVDESPVGGAGNTVVGPPGVPVGGDGGGQ